MADVKTLQTRIALKYDSYANWTDETKEGLGANLVLLKGEIGICAIESKDQGAQTAPTVLFKVGDGENAFKNLKWASALAADVYDWAKSETVVLDGTTIQFKTGDNVNHSVDLSSFATDAEVKTIRSGLDARIVALEGKFEGDSSVQGQLDALDGRLDVIEGEGAGSIKRAEADAKAYADTQDTALKTELQGYADQAEADAISAANKYTDGKVATINAKDAEQDTAIEANATAIANEKTAREQADQAINTKIGTVADGKDVVTMISDAQAAAEATAAADATSKVKALEEGKVAKNAAAIEALQTAVSDEAKARDDADKALDERLDSVEAFFKLEEGQKLDTALDTLKEIQDYLNGEGDATGGLIYRIATAEGDIDKLEAEFANGGRVTKAEADIVALDGRLDAIEGDNGTIAKGDADTLAAAKTYAEEKATAAETAAKSHAETKASEAQTAAVNAAKAYTDEKVEELDSKDEELAADIEALEKIVKGYTEEGSIKTAVDAAKKAADKAQEAADKAQGEVDDLEAVVATLRSEYDVTKTLATTNEAAIAALETNKLDASAFTTWKGTHEADHAKTATKITAEIAAAVKVETDRATDAEDVIKATIGTIPADAGYTTIVDGIAAVKTVADRADATSEANADRLDTIESDYLKMADLFIIDCGSATEVTHEKPAKA